LITIYGTAMLPLVEISNSPKYMYFCIYRLSCSQGLHFSQPLSDPQQLWMEKKTGLNTSWFSGLIVSMNSN